MFHHNEGNRLKVTIFDVWPKPEKILWSLPVLKVSNPHWIQLTRDCSWQMVVGSNPLQLATTITSTNACGCRICKYVNRKDSAVLNSKQPAVVALEVNLWITMARKHEKKGIYPALETQSRHHHASIICASVASQKGLVSCNFFFQRKGMKEIGSSLQPKFVTLLSVIFVQINLPGACHDRTRDRRLLISRTQCISVWMKGLIHMEWLRKQGEIFCDFVASWCECCIAFPEEWCRCSNRNSSVWTMPKWRRRS